METYWQCKHVQIWVLLISALIQTFLANIIYEKTQADTKVISEVKNGNDILGLCL